MSKLIGPFVWGRSRLYIATKECIAPRTLISFAAILPGRFISVDSGMKILFCLLIWMVLSFAMKRYFQMRIIVPHQIIVFISEYR